MHRGNDGDGGDRAQNSVTERFQKLGFQAFNLSPRPQRAHRLPTGIYGPEPRVITGTMMWKAPQGVTGLVPVRASVAEGLQSVPAGQRMRTEDLYGISVSELHRQKRVAEVDTFRIAYTIMWPSANVPPGDFTTMERLPLICLLHGVPMNRRAKYGVMRWLARFGICVALDMLGMGESDMPLGYGTAADFEANLGVHGMKGKMDYQAFNRQWDWIYDTPYVHQLMMEHVPKVLHLPKNRPFIFQADDWGTGIAMAYASDPVYTKDLRMLFLLNAVMLDGYPVIEIASIGRLAELHLRDPKSFGLLAGTLPQAMVGIEKYMVTKQKNMNRYTETDYMFPYTDTDYQSGRMASEMHHSEWALLVLANRSSRLAPRLLQPADPKRPSGVLQEGLHTENMRAPVHMIWGTDDQMMPPAQLDRAMYLWPNAHSVTTDEVAGADHFVEIDKPVVVARYMLRAINGILGRGTTRAMVGLDNGGDGVTYKGDEPEFARAINEIYGVGGGS